MKLNHNQTNILKVIKVLEQNANNLARYSEDRLKNNASTNKAIDERFYKTFTDYACTYWEILQLFENKEYFNKIVDIYQENLKD